jgi:uncharacterized protein (DUF697 family)
MQTAMKCKSCDGFTTLIGEFNVCRYCDPLIQSPVTLSLDSISHLPVGTALQFPLDFEQSRALEDSSGVEVGIIPTDIVNKLKEKESEYSFLPIVFQNTHEKLVIFFYPEKRKVKTLSASQSQKSTQFDRVREQVRRSLEAEKQQAPSIPDQEQMSKIAEQRAHEADAILKENISEKDKVQKIILWGSGICAGVAIQPIPFADIFILTPIQAVMAMKIGAAKGITITKKAATDIIIELGGVVGMGYLAQQTALQLLKFIPGGSLFTIPYVFGATYAMGKVCEYYYDTKLSGNDFSADLAKKMFKNALTEGKKSYEKDKK